MIKLLIFDWDDVFTLGSTEGYIACYHNALLGVGVNLDPVEERKRINANWGKSHQEEIKGLLKEHPELVVKACEIYEQNLFGNTFVNHLSVIPGVKDLLIRLSEKYILCIATGVHPKLLEEKIIPKFNIPSVFEQIVTAYDIPEPDLQKPNPYSLELIMKTQNIEAEQTIFIGDAENDMTMAKNAQVHALAVLTGHLSLERAKELSVPTINDIGEIEKFLASYNY